MAWAAAEDVISAWIGDDAPSDIDRIQTWIGKAEREVRYRVPDISVRLEAETGTDLHETVIDVVVAMVIRKFTNPKGYRQVGNTTGPFSEQATFGGDNPGELYLTDDECARLSGATGRQGQAFAIDLMPTTSPFSPNYVPAYPWL